MSDTKQLAFSAAQIDAILAAAAKCSSRNLLDNAYFANPVDQRGGYVVPPGLPYRKASDYSIVGNTDKYYTASYIDDAQNPHFHIDGVEYYIDSNNVTTPYVRGYTGVGYGIDRWCSNEVSNTTLIYDDHITITRQHVQIIDNYHELVGRQVTISALTNLGLLVATGVCTNNDGEQAYGDDGNGHNIMLYNNGSYHGFQVNNTNGGTLDLYGAKLELGSQQTLAHQDADGNWVLNEIPDYGEQLARCQRYYYKPEHVLLFRTPNTDSFTMDCQFKTVMRTKPSAIYSNPLTVLVPGKTASGIISLTSVDVFKSGVGNCDLTSATPPDATICQVEHAQMAFTADL